LDKNFGLDAASSASRFFRTSSSTLSGCDFGFVLHPFFSFFGIVKAGLASSSADSGGGGGTATGGGGGASCAGGGGRKSADGGGGGGGGTFSLGGAPLSGLCIGSTGGPGIRLFPFTILAIMS